MLLQHLRLNIDRFFCIPLTASVVLSFTISLPSAALSHNNHRHRRRFASKMSMNSPPQAQSPLPPKAKKVEHKMEMFGDVRIDNYYWLRDDTRSDPEVLSHLHQENAYAEYVMSGTKETEDKIYEEIRGRIKEEDLFVPSRKGSYYYYKKTLEGKEYVQHCRRLIPESQKVPSVNDIMPTGPEAPHEHVILDENIKAQNHPYYSIGAFKVSPNNKLVAYTEDTKGDEIYTAYVIDVETQAPFGEPLVGLTGDLNWVGDGALAYITRDDTLRPYKAWLHVLGTEQSKDTCLYVEKDDTFGIVLYKSESKKYLFLESRSKNSSFNFYLDVSKPEEGLKVLTSRVDGIGTTCCDHRGDHFFILRSDQFFNSEIIACAVNDISSTTVLIPHRESVTLQKIQLFSDHLVVIERENGLPKITVYHLPPIGESLRSLENGHMVSFIDPVYSVESLQSEFSSSILRFLYSSMKTPPSVYDYDMKTGISVLKKIEPVLGGFDTTHYVTERKWAPALDGTLIPISLVYRKDLVKLDGSDPLLLYGYGSYQVRKDPSFMSSRISLLDRGFIYAIAHIRGGGEIGMQWYANGKLMKKINTFTDFIACAEHLIEKKFCSKERLCINGGSAGGLLIGVVLNMRPDLFKVAATKVPFVDVVTTMLDPTIPLTTSEWKEWGDPREEEFYFYMKSYSPVDNVVAQNYPHILVTAGLNDQRVLYFEPAKYVAKLRDMKTDDNMLLFKCNLAAGHFANSGRFEELREEAFIFAFILKALNMQ